MASKFLNISTDNTLGGVSPSDEVVSSQKAIKEYVDSQGGGGGSVAIDNLSITKNSSNEIQAVAVINQNTAVGATNPKYDWVGTLAEYNAQNVETLHPEWICYITDDVSGGLSVYTKNQTDTLISTAVNAAISTAIGSMFPVGSIFITTEATCPLSTLIAGSTWVLVGQDRVLQGAGTRGVVGTTLNESLPNITGAIGTQGTYGFDAFSGYTGAFEADTSAKNNWQANTLQQNISGKYGVVKFDASRSSSTYQDNAPVQPDAYLVNIFERTA